MEKFEMSQSQDTPRANKAPGAANGKPQLWASHVEVLRARAIPPDFAIAHGLWSVDLGGMRDARERHGVRPSWPNLPLPKGATGIGIEYQITLDEIPRARVRVDKIEVTIPGPVNGSHHGETVARIPRYICQKDVSVVPYIPPEVFAVAGDTNRPLYIVEAPLKALSLTANGFPAVGLGGVLAGANDTEVLESLDECVISKELARVNWAGRVAYVVFDAGIHDNPIVALGAARLALGLLQAGADIWFVTVPYFHPTESDPESAKFWSKTDQGPDDFIARSGVEAFKTLVEHAVPANPITRAAQATPGGATAVAAVLGELPVQAMLHEGGDLIVDQVAATTKGVGIGKKSVQQAVRTFVERIHRREHASDAGWKQCIRRTASGGAMGSVHNALLIVQNDDRINRALGFDELREEPAWITPPPWVTVNVAWTARAVSDEDATRLVSWLDSEHDVRIAIPTAHAVIDAAARAKPFHRLRDYLAGAKHDGVERVAGRSRPGWLTTYLGVPDSPYIRAVGRMMLVGAVARVRRPGCKLDTMLVLEGMQGKKKSTAVETLFGADYFSDQLSEVTTKDASSDLRGKWVIEWSELDNLSRPESSAVKKYITRRVDDYRPSYGRRNIRVPRQCVFVGTTNKENYLKDETGNRRFWPVRCVGEIDVESLARDRDLLWAETVTLFESGERWWFTGEDGVALEAAKSEQEARRVPHPWEAVIAKALDAGLEETTDDEMNVIMVPRPAINETTTQHVIERVLNIPAERQTKGLPSIVGECMHALGWVRRQRRLEGERREWYYGRAVTTSPPVTADFRGGASQTEQCSSAVSDRSSEVGGDGGDGGDTPRNHAADRVTTCPTPSGDGGDRATGMATPPRCAACADRDHALHEIVTATIEAIESGEDDASNVFLRLHDGREAVISGFTDASAVRVGERLRVRCHQHTWAIGQTSVLVTAYGPAPAG